MGDRGALLKKTGYFVWVVCGVWGLIFCLAIVGHAMGFWGVVVAMILAPITLAATPWYAVAAWGTWVPLIVIYGGGFAGAVLNRLAANVRAT